LYQTFYCRYLSLLSSTFYCRYQSLLS
jgi:hypothetical protein